MEATQVLVLQRNEFLDVINKKPDAAAEIMSILSYRLRRATSLLEDAVFLDLPARLAKRLLELADKHGVNTDEGLRIDLRLSQHELANSTGASRESVNRLLGQFQDRGLLRIDKQCFLIIDMDGLKEYIR
jgi:CRP/FNR family transcriptional regulator/CRP/FNR family cyclic AMP-dependent transcriptional regulator